MLPGLITSPSRFNEGTPAQVGLTFHDVVAQAVVAQTSMTVPGMGIGTAQDDRIVYLCIGVEGDSILGSNVASIAIGERPAQLAHSSVNTGVSPDLINEIWYAYVPLGTTADIVVNFNSSTSDTIYFATFRAVNVTIPVFATANNAVASGTSISTTLNIPALGAALAFGTAAIDNGSHNWSGLTERSDNDPGTYLAGTASNEVPAGDSSRSITWTGLSSARCLVAISIR